MIFRRGSLQLNSILLLALIVPAVIRGTSTTVSEAIPKIVELPRRRELQGTLSCAASACHGGSAIGQARSEVTTWSALDPHARAYETLLAEKSKAIAKHLWADKLAAHEAPLCLRCHVHADYEQARPNFRKEEGVGCESCHGAAHNWLGTHYRKNWQLTSWTEKQALGLANTKSLDGRAGVCAKCHVGTPETNVDHDLIAAGHPALRFEFATYFANLPAHWDVARDKKVNSSSQCVDFEARAWAVGQLVTSATALDLLAHRAAGKAWPEFAELDCFSCHHDLQVASWRQKSEYLGKRRPGTLVMSNWYYAMLPAVLPTEGDGKSAEEWRGFLNRNHANNRGAIATQAQDLAKTLRETAVKPPQLVEGGACSVLPLMKRLTGEQDRDLSWDDASQRYLAFLALRQMQKDDQQADIGKLEALISRLREDVTFRSDLNSPSRFLPGVFNNRK